MQRKYRLIGLVAGPLLFALVMLFFHPLDMSQEAQAVLASTVWIATWWITEAIPIPVTSLLPLVLFPLSGALDIGATAAAYGNPLVFLYIGGFIVAVAIEKWDLHKRIALEIINRMGTKPQRLVLGFMIATAFLSMWISNTATSVMMLPIGMAIVGQFSSHGAGKEFGKALMLSIAYAASIGGVATLIGSPTNLVFAGIAEELYDMDIAFSDWFFFALPISVILLFIAWKYLTGFAYPVKQMEIGSVSGEIQRQLRALGKMNIPERRVAFVFAAAAISWILRSFLLEGWLPGINDTIIAIAAATALFVIPAGGGRKEPLLTWDTAVRIPWGIVLLFGGGLALAEGFQHTGLAEWIGSRLTILTGVHLVLILLVIIAAVNFLTEITSNVATVSMILPILASLALAIDVHPYLLMVGATVASSCAFMLPVATPPNAVVFGSGYLSIVDMARAGLWMNLISILVLTLAVYLTLPILWSL